MADARVSSSHRSIAVSAAVSLKDNRPHVVEREEIVDVTTEEFVVDGGSVAAHQTPSRERADDEIDVTTISNSPNGATVAPVRAPSKSTPSAMNLDNFIREDARLSALRKMQQSRAASSSDGDYRQATDHDYASSANRNGGSRFGSAAFFRQSVLPSAAYAASSAPRAETNTTAPATAAPISPSAIHRRKRKGASMDHAADSDSDDPDEKLFRSAKIEYTKAYNPEDTNDFSCPRCPAQFESRVGLTNHLKLHGSAKQFPCSMCDFCCTNKKTMRQHRRIHGVVRRPGKQAAAAAVAVAAAPVELKDEIEVDEPDDEEFFERSPERQEVSVMPMTTRAAKYASSSAGVRKPPVGAPSASRLTPATRQSLTRSAAVHSRMRTPPKTRRSGEAIDPPTEAALSKSADSVDEPPALRAVGINVNDEKQMEQATTNQPIIRAIDFALKLNLDEHGNPLPLPARDAMSANQSFTFGIDHLASSAPIVSPPTTAAVVTKSSPAGKAKREEEEMPLLPQEMQHEETSDDNEPEDGQTAGGSNKNRVKCKDCPFTARTVAHLQPHLLGHVRETGYKCQFCTFKTESLGFIKRHINIHNEAQFTWPPEYVGDSQEHIQKLLAKERKRLALERRRKAEAQHKGSESSLTKPTASKNDMVEDEEAKDDTLGEESESFTPTPRRRGAKVVKLEQEEPTRRSTRTSRPPKPVYTAGEAHSARRAQATVPLDEPAGDDFPLSATSKRSARKSTSDTSVGPSSGQKPAATNSLSTSSAGGKTPVAEFNKCKLCDYKVAARAPAAVMIRHVMRRHKAEDATKNT